MAAAQTVLAVCEECPSDLLNDLGHPDTPLYSAIDVVRSLHSAREYTVNVVRTRSGRMAVLKTYYKFRLSDVARQQVCVCLLRAPKQTRACCVRLSCAMQVRGW